MSKHEEILSKYENVMPKEGDSMILVTKENALKAMKEVEDSCPRWIKATERLPEDLKRERPVRANNLFWVAWYSEEIKRWLTDFDESFSSTEENVEWLEQPKTT